jgi:hypothetical protein
LQQELIRLRGPNLDFDFSVIDTNQANGTTKVPATTATVPRNPFQPNSQANGQQQSSPSPSNGSNTDSSIFRSGQSSLATSPEHDANKNATPNIDVPFDLFSNSAGPVTFNTNHSSNQSSPLFSTDLFGNFPASTTNNNSSFTQVQNQTISPILDSFASTLASLQKGQSPTSLTGANTFGSNVSSIFSSDPNSNNSTSLYDLNDPLFSSWRDNSISSSGGDDSGFDIFDTMFSSMSSMIPGAFNLVDMTGLTEFIIDSPDPMHQNFPQPPQPQQQQNLQAVGGEQVTCAELWAQVQNHPNFDDIDIDELCAEMRSKAKVCVLSKSSLR